MTTPPPTKVNPREVTFPRPGSEFNAWPSTRRDEVVLALKEHGCFIAKYEMLDGNRSKLFEASKEIFNHLDRTNYDKREFAYKKEDQYESFDIPEATTDEGIKKLIPERWPAGPEGKDDRRNDILAYTRTAAELEKMVRKMVPEHYKLPKESTGYIFQMMKYKKEVRLDFSNREDKFLAVLDLNQVNGLTMTTTDGQCFSINVRPSTFLIMASKPFKDWKEGKIHLEHGNEERYSVGLFSYCDKGNTEASKEQVGSSSR